MFSPLEERICPRGRAALGGCVSLRAAAIAVSFALATVAIPGFADTQHLRPGDRLTYDITLQVQQHVAGKGTSKNDRAVDSSAGAGTETLSILTVDPDGTANGTLSVDMLGVAHGQPVVLHKWMTVRVTPSGEIRPAASIDPLLDQAITLANRSVRDLASRDLLNSRSWRSQMQADTYPMTIALDHLRRNRRRLQAQARANLLFDLRRQVGKDSHRARELSHAHVLGRRLKSRNVALRL